MNTHIRDGVLPRGKENIGIQYLHSTKGRSFEKSKFPLQGSQGAQYRHFKSNKPSGYLYREVSNSTDML
jgi:hypothetical protein